MSVKGFLVDGVPVKYDFNQLDNIPSVFNNQDTVLEESDLVSGHYRARAIVADSRDICTAVTYTVSPGDAVEFINKTLNIGFLIYEAGNNSASFNTGWIGTSNEARKIVIDYSGQLAVQFRSPDNSDITTAAFAQNSVRIINSFRGHLGILAKNFADEFREDIPYEKDTFCVRNEQLYRAKYNIPSGVWDDSKWEMVQFGNEMNDSLDDFRHFITNYMTNAVGKIDKSFDVDWIEGYSISSNGTIVASDSYHYTDTIFVDSQEEYRIYFGVEEISDSAVVSIHGYDVNGNWVSQLYSWTIDDEDYFDVVNLTGIPSNVSWIRISTPNYIFIDSFLDGNSIGSQVWMGQSGIANHFDPENPCEYGSYYWYHDELYKCTNPNGHTGVWTDADFESAVLGEDVKSVSEQIEQIAQVRELPDLPTTDGTYVLKATVSSGTATLAWVSDAAESEG